MSRSVDSFNYYINIEKEKLSKNFSDHFSYEKKFKNCYTFKNNNMYREIIRQNIDLFKLILDQYPEDIINLGMFLTGNKEYDINEFLNDCKISIWDIFFKYNLNNIDFNLFYNYYDENNDNEFNVILENQTKLFNLIIFNNNDNLKKELKFYLKEDKVDNINKVLDIIFKLDMGYDNSSVMEVRAKNVFNTIKFITENGFNFKIWQHYINMVIAVYPKELEYIYNNFRWVLLNIDFLNVSKIAPHIDYYIDSDRNNSFKYFCHNVLQNLKNLINICELKPEFSQSLKQFLNDDYLNKIICIHSNTEILDKIYKLFGRNIFKLKDSKDFHILSDALRYGDLNCVKWIFENVLVDNCDLEIAIYNLFNDLQGFSYVFENKDWRILDIFLKKIETSFSQNQILLFDWSLINISVVSNFSKKTRLLINFVKKNCIQLLDYYNFIKDILFNYENDICKNKSFILEELYENRQYVKFNKLSYFILNKSNKNLDSIKKIIDIYRVTIINYNLNDQELNTFIIKNFIDDFRENYYYQSVYYNKKKTYSFNNTLCICELKQTILDIINYAYKKEFVIEDFYKVMKTANLRVIDNFNNFWDLKSNERLISYTFNNLLEIMYNFRHNSLEHGCYNYNKDQIEDEIIKFFTNLIIIDEKNGFRNLYNSYPGISFFRRDYDFSIDFLKKLLKNQFYFKYYKNILYKHIYPASYNNEMVFLRIFNYYYIDDNNYSKIVEDNLNEIKKIRKQLCLFGILDGYLLSLASFTNKALKINSKTKFLTHVKDASLKFFQENKINMYKVLNTLDTLLINRAYTVFKKNEFVNQTRSLLYKISSLDNVKRSHLITKKNIKSIDISVNKLQKITKERIYFLKSIDKIQKELFGFLQIKINVRRKISSQFKLHKDYLDKVCLDIVEKKYKTDSINNKLLNTSNSCNNDNLLLDLLSSLSDNTTNVNISDSTSKLSANFENESEILSNTQSEKLSITRPTLIKLYNVFQNFKTHTILTLKIDGLTCRSKSLNNSYPICPVNTLFDIEFVEKDNMNFIIAISNSQLFGKTKFIDEINNLRQHHNWTKDNLIPTGLNIKKDFQKIISILKLEAVNYLEYINESKKWSNNGKKLWWPKLFFNISYDSDDFKEYIENINSIITYFNSFVHRNTIINDGWILMHKNYLSNKDINKDHLRAFKIKSRDLMTVDLKFINGDWLFNEDNSNISKTTNFSNYFKYQVTVTDRLNIRNNSIYRCYPIFESKQYDNDKDNDNLPYIQCFEARDLRIDKRQPNTKSILSEILNEINNYWTFSQLLTCISNDKPEYYTLKLDKKLNKCSKTKYNLQYNIIQKYTNGSLLDIGGGSSTKKYIKGIENQLSSCVSTDSDLSIVISNNAKTVTNSNKLNIIYKYLNFTSDNTNSIQKALTLEKHTFDTVFAMNCINFAFENSEKMNKFAENINKFTKINSKLLIRFMDLEAFTKKIFNLDKNYLIRNNQLIIKNDSNPSFINIDFEQKINRIYYNWAHEAPINENMVGKMDIENLLNIHGWKFTEYEYNKNYDKLNNDSSLWDIYFNCFSTAVFTRN
jgi:hypothetical protein